MKHKITVMAAVLVFLLGGVAYAHTEPAHTHSWGSHGIVTDAPLVGHNSVYTCTDGALNLDIKRETHYHYEKKNQSDIWRQSAHSVQVLYYGPAWNLCG